MCAITLVTGNPGKLAEWRQLLPSGLLIEIADIDLPEIQSLDSEEIVADKARRAYEIVKSPVLVEDVAVGLDKLSGLPGPFMKFFEQKLGQDALYKLAGKANEPVIITCTIGYYDGFEMIFAHGEIKGTVVAPRGRNGFGFDPVVVPQGQTKTFAEMTIEEKNRHSHRALAIQQMVQKLTELPRQSQTNHQS